MWEGGVHHRDSRGNNSVVGGGGVQWTDVGMGIIHERLTELCENGGVQEIIQIWVNLPKAKKSDGACVLPFKKRNCLLPTGIQN